MAVLAQSELLKEITGIDESKTEEFFFRMDNIMMSPLRKKCLKRLIVVGKATVSSLLKDLGEANYGGTYQSIKGFFNKLVEEGILTKQPVGIRTYYCPSKPASEFMKYLNI